MRLSLRPARTTALLITLATVALGCSAELDEGVFDCRDGGGCPDGWRCFPDNYCYSPSFAGLPLYEPCDVDEQCMSGTCTRPYDETATLGQCSQACTSTCPTEGGVAGACAPNVGCLRSCDTAADCSDAESCVVAPMTQGVTVCAEFVTTEFVGETPCMGGGDCNGGSICMRAQALDNRGICVWPCAPGGGCPPGASCEAIPTAIASVGMNPEYACMATCTDPPNSCDAGLACQPFPDSERHCTPPGW